MTLPSVPLRSTARRILVSALAVGLLAALWSPAPTTEAEVLNRIVLQVNDRIATLMDYELRRAQVLGDMAAEMSPAELDRARPRIGERVFRDLFEEMLLLSRADQLQIKIPEDYLTNVINSVRGNMGIENDEEFEIALAQTGLSIEDFRERWRTNLRMREVIGQEVNAALAADLTEEALRKVYTENPERFYTTAEARLREVVVLDTSDLSAEERRELAAELAEALRLDADVEVTIASHAEAGRTSKLIDLGWVGPGELAPTLDELAFSLDAEEVGKPVEARGGLHVVQVLERREPSLPPFKDVIGQVRDEEQDRLYDERYAEFMDRLEARSYIRIEPPPDAAGFRRVASSLADEVAPDDAEARVQEIEAEAAEPVTADGEPLEDSLAVNDQEEILPIGVVTDSDDEPGASSSAPQQPELIPPVGEVEGEQAPVPPDPPPV